MKKRSLFLATACMAVLGGIGSAQAGQIIQTLTFPPGAAPYSLSTMYANQFDGPGTLTSVVITFSSTITGTVDVLNLNSSAESYSNATSTVPVSFTGPNGLAFNVSSTTQAQAGTVAAATPPSYTLTPLTSETAGATESTTFTSSLGSFIGSGMGDLGFTFAAGAGSFGGSGGAGVYFGGSATAGATVTIIYNSNFAATAVPEPASLGLLGIGVAGLITFQRFYNKRAAKV